MSFKVCLVSLHPGSSGTIIRRGGVFKQRKLEYDRAWIQERKTARLKLFFLSCLSANYRNGTYEFESVNHTREKYHIELSATPDHQDYLSLFTYA